MEQFPEILDYLKDYKNALASEVKQRMKRIEKTQQQLSEHINAENTQRVQAAVQMKMGPKMCDNTQEKSRQQKFTFQEILRDFKNLVETGRKHYQAGYSQLKEQLALKINQIKELSKLQQRQWEQDRRQIGEYNQKMKSSMSSKISNIKSTVICQQISDKLNNLEHSLEISELEEKIKHRKDQQQITSLLMQIQEG